MKLFSKIRCTVPFIVSLIVLAWVCSYEFRSTSYQNETWFGVLVLFILGLCALFMYWGMGGFSSLTSKKRKAYVCACKKERGARPTLPSLSERLISGAYAPVDLWPDDPLLAAEKVAFFSRQTKKAMDYVCVLETERITANLSSHLTTLVKTLADSEADRTDHFCFVVIFLSAASAKVAERAVLDCCRYGVAHGCSNMILSCHIHRKTGMLHLSPPSAVGYTLWRRKKNMLVRLLQ